MKLTEEIKKKISEDYQNWFDKQYSDKSLAERQKLGQFFTPADITIKMIESFKFDEFGDRTILDPCCGSGNLLVACIIAGAKPENIYGNDFDPIMVDLCRERLMKLGVPKYNIHEGNALHDYCLDKSHFNKGYYYKDTGYDFRQKNNDKYIDRKQYDLIEESKHTVEVDLW